MLLGLMITLSSLSIFTPLKISVYDQQPLALTVYSIDLELEGFETPEESRFQILIFNLERVKMPFSG